MDRILGHFLHFFGEEGTNDLIVVKPSNLADSGNTV